jgi:DNA polymerase III subunit gamma/tau
MENFVVSARKYRPQHFSTVVGQSHITTTLKNAILQNHLAHAFLFCGPRGVGKTTCARILAKTINCEKLGKDGEACDKCNSCQSFNKGASFNIHELDAASNNSVDDIRELIEQVRFAPQAGKYKIYIIDEVHMLSASAFNAFLKTLEEPPAHAIFILATTEKHKILPTILSRCQIFDFKRITPSDIVAYLEEIASKEKITAENAAMQLIAQKSDGCMRDALSMLDKIVSFTSGKLTYSSTLEHLNVLDEEYFFQFLELLQKEDLPGIMSLYDEIDQKGFEGDTVLNLFSSFFRNLLISKDARSIGLLQVVEAFRKKYIAVASELSTAYMIGALNILNEAELGFKQARNKKLHVEFHLIRLTYLQQAVNIVHDEAAGKKKRLNEIKPVAFRQIGFIEEKNKTEKKQTAAHLTSKNNEASLKIDSQILEEKKVSPSPTVTPIEKPREAGALKKIREQILTRKLEPQTARTLNDDGLMQAWNEYLQKLQENNQVTSHHNLKTASISITNELQFDVFVTTKIQQQFIESERTNLLIYMQDFFNNPRIQFKISLDPEAEKEPVSTEQTLSQRDQYLKMISMYPLVKEMRDQLNLDLDY